MTKEELTLLELTSRMEFWKAMSLRLMEDLSALSPVEPKNELDAAPLFDGPITGKEWKRAIDEVDGHKIVVMTTGATLE